MALEWKKLALLQYALNPSGDPAALGLDAEGDLRVVDDEAQALLQRVVDALGEDSGSTVNSLLTVLSQVDFATSAQQDTAQAVYDRIIETLGEASGASVLAVLQSIDGEIKGGVKIAGADDTWKTIYQHNIPPGSSLPSGPSITVHPVLNTEPNVVDSGWILNSNPDTGVKWNNQRLTVGGDVDLLVYVLNANDDQGSGIRNEGTPFLFPAANETRVISAPFFSNYYRIITVNQSGQTLTQLNLTSDGGTASSDPISISLDAPVFGQFPGALNQSVIRGKMAGLDQYEPIGTDGLGRLQTINGSNFSRLLSRQVEDNQRLLVDAEPGTGYIFLGEAPRGTTKATTIWKVVRIELSATLNPQDIQYKEGIAWDDRYTASHWDNT